MLTLAIQSSDMFILDEEQGRPEVAYAGFGYRLVAYLIDALILGVVRFILSLLFGVSFLDNDRDLLWFDSIFNFMYFIVLESSSRQATYGKRFMNLRVVDENGDRISLGKAVVRNLSKIISAFILLIGFIMIAFDSRKQGLHDKIAGTFVVQD